MKKVKFVSMITLLLISVFVITLMPVTIFAAGSYAFEPVADILPGGENVGFHDNPSAGGSVRGLEAEGTLGVCLRQSEWVKYKMTGVTPGVYQLSFVNGNTSTVMVNVSINDELVLNKASVKSVGSYTSHREVVVGTITVKEPNSILTIESANESAMYLSQIKLIDYETIEKRNAFLGQNRPYKMAYMPCIVEAENFDSGIKGIAYYDSDAGNVGGEYRKDSDVDIYADGKMRYVNMTTDDFMTYTINTEKTGNYNLILKLVDITESSKIRIYMDGYEILRVIPERSIPTGTMKEFVVGTFYIKEGVHTLRIKCLDGDVNLDYIRFDKSKKEGLDISKTEDLRPWMESQDLSDEDYIEEEVIINPVECEIYVDASATANGDGSKEKPFNNIYAAKDYVKTVNDKMNGDIVVNLKGEFKVDETLTFTEEDSGNGIYNIIYRGDGDAAIHGGRKVEGWKQVANSPLWQTKLEDVSDFRQLYVGDNRGTRSRSEWLYWMVGKYDNPSTGYTNPEGYFIKSNDFPQGFSKPEGMEMIWMPSWTNVKMPVKSMKDMGDGRILVEYPQPYFEESYNSSAPITEKIPYYFENAPEFLDRPGEFYFNKDTKILTYYPFSYEDMNTIDCYIPETEMLINISGTDRYSKVRNITFEGIEFKYGAWERTSEKGFATLQADCMLVPDNENDTYGDGMILPAQVQVHFAENINFKKNEFIHLGSAALSFNNATNLCVAEGNLFDDISATAVTMGDWRITATDPLEEYTRKIKVRNNLIRRTSVEYMTPIITGYYVNGITVDHNDILDAPYTGISMGWGWGTNYQHSANNRMTNNRIENVIFKLRDGGHIYTLDSMKGGVISGNYCKKSDECKGGIYHDNSSAYIRTTNNVFEDCPKWYKITWHNIHDNIAYNNYADRPFLVTYPENNNVEEAKGKVNGQWPEEAKKIIENAGLTNDYRYILEEYNKKGNLRNDILERQKYQEGPGVFLEAGKFMEGGEGVGYHDILGNSDFRNLEGEPSVEERYDGTGGLNIMVTVQGEWTKHKFTVTEAGEYEVFTKLAVVGDSTAVTVEVDDKVVGKEVPLAENCKGYEIFTEYSTGTIYLEPGEHVVKVEHAIGNFGFEGIRIAKVGEAFDRNDGFKSELLNVVLGK